MSEAMRSGPSGDPLARLIQQLGKLPGIGERTATRLAFHILRAPETYALQLAQAIREVRERLRQCSVCCQLTETDPCRICSDARRDEDVIMVVALPQDLLAVERTASFRGRYHVLHGLLAPLDGIGPDELKIKPLLARLGSGAIKEVILATSPNVEGDATALYLAGLIKPLGLVVTRIASGVPIGGELEYADGVTLHRAIEGRQAM
jgi:recombination protein RecR